MEDVQQRPSALLEGEDGDRAGDEARGGPAEQVLHVKFLRHAMAAGDKGVAPR